MKYKLKFQQNLLKGLWDTWESPSISLYPYYESVWLKVGIAQQRFLEVSQAEFQQNLWVGLWHTWKSPFIVLCKVSFVVDQQYSENGNCHTTLIPTFYNKKICPTV
jgi:hypothetical protein